LQPGAQTGQLVTGAHCEYFYTAVGIIAYPTRNSQRVRFAFNKPAKADTLHTPANNKTASLRNRVIG
jgi:hypothetical protein